VTDLDRFRAACAYPSAVDEQAVERELAAPADREAAFGE